MLFTPIATLRAKEKCKDMGNFHINMLKGTSVHKLAQKWHLTAERISKLPDDCDAQQGNYEMLHIDSFCLNTMQGGYEMLCVQEAALCKLKELKPDIDETVFCSDDGSGYKSTQTILGLCASKDLTGISVHHIHFNASGEGKHWETDGHNTAIKARWEEALKAGKPLACNTPASEVEAQHFLGSCPGTFPFVLEFDNSNEAGIEKPLDGIQSYHDFQYHDNGDITVRKSFNIGEGK
jgi:hypothetical protein